MNSSSNSIQIIGSSGQNRAFLGALAHYKPFLDRPVIAGPIFTCLFCRRSKRTGLHIGPTQCCNVGNHFHFVSPQQVGKCYGPHESQVQAHLSYKFGTNQTQEQANIWPRQKFESPLEHNFQPIQPSYEKLFIYFPSLFMLTLLLFFFTPLKYTIKWNNKLHNYFGKFGHGESLVGGRMLLMFMLPCLLALRFQT